jgi:hypothetical protein
MNRNTAVTNKNIMIFKDSISSLENRVNNLENVVKVAVVVTVFCHIWKKMKKKRESGSDENQVKNG